MSINRDLWKNWFLKSDFNQIPCPNCIHHTLGFDKDSMIEIETVASEKYRHKAEFADQMDYSGIFTATLKCLKCRDTVVVTGDSAYDVAYDSSGEPSIEMVFAPKIFHPTVFLFPLGSEIPDNVKSEVKTGFSLFWQDYSACGNRLRVAVENLLDEFNIPRFNKDKKLIRLSLHERILEFKSRVPKFAEISDKLMALKWIGNDSSHSSNLTKDDVFDALDILSFVFDEIYQGRREMIIKLVSKINKQKGIIKKRKPNRA
jgi:hypothetical protein